MMPSPADKRGPDPDPADDASSAADQQSLAHGRPALSLAREILLVFTVCLSQLWLQAGLGQVVAPLHIIGHDLGASSFGQLSWYAASYSLTVSVFILPAGRLGDMFGHRLVTCSGLAWYGVWSLAAGFAPYSSSPSIFFSICRGLQGVGQALAVPNSLAILGRTYHVPGPRKNLVFSLFGATAPTGFTVGALFSSLFAVRVSWTWAYWTSAIASVAFIVLILLALPPDDTVTKSADDRRFDYLGILTGVASLFLINVAINQGAVVGWTSAPGSIYLPILLAIGVLCLPLFCYTQLRQTKTLPLVPLRDLGTQGSFALACIACCWGSFGIFVFYVWQLLETVRGHSVLLATAESSPVCVTGLLAALLTGWLLPRVKTAYLMVTAMLAFIIGLVLLATVPADQIYWGQTFVALLVIPIGLDMSFPAGIVMVSNCVPKERQGVAGSLVNTVVNWSISMGLGLAATIEASVNRGREGADLLQGYRAAWYFGVALDLVGLAISLYFVLVTLRSASTRK